MNDTRGTSFVHFYWDLENYYESINMHFKFYVYWFKMNMDERSTQIIVHGFKLYTPL